MLKIKGMHHYIALSKQDSMLTHKVRSSSNGSVWNILLTDLLTSVFKWISSVFNYSTLFLICISSNDTVPAFKVFLET